MSKFSKLIKSPGLFFRDVLINKYGEQRKDKERKGKIIKTVEKPVETKLISCVILDFLKFIKIKYVIHTGEGLDFGRYHLAQWVPYFLKKSINVLVLVRNQDLYKFVRKQWPFVICVYAKTVIEVDKVLDRLPYGKTIFYLSNTGNLVHSLRRNDFNHVFLGHGDSNKFASAHKFFRVYDEIWVSGDAHIDRFKNAGFDVKHITFKKIGRPNLEELIKINQKTKWQNRSPKIAIIAPTWEGVLEENNGSSVEKLHDIISVLIQNNFIVKIKFHPATGKRRKDYIDIEKEIIRSSKEMPEKINVLPKEKSLENLLINPCLCIGDTSGAITEFLSCYCPIVIYKPEKELIESNSNMNYDQFCYSWRTREEFEAIVLKLASHEDPLSDNRAKAQNYYLGISNTLNESFFNLLIESPKQ